jgi:hypothetical protein
MKLAFAVLLALTAISSAYAGASFPLLQPDPLLLTGCTAEQTCPNGSQISCTGTNTCNVYGFEVSCDGQITECSCVIDGPDPYCVCQCFIDFPTAGPGRASCIKCCTGVTPACD